MTLHIHRSIARSAAISLILFALPAHLNAAEPKVFKSDDGRLQLELTSDWEATEKKPDVELRIHHSTKSMLIKVTIDPKEDYDGLEGYATKYLKGFGEEHLKNREVGPLKRLQINGYPAIQCQVIGSMNGAKYVYTVTALDMPSFFIHVQTSAPPSVFAKNKDELINAINGLREVPAKDK
jgi:hypothetical protein